MVEYQLSGAVGARVGGALAPLGGPKQRCVLAVLLANHGTVVSVDRLIDAVWEDKPPPKALASLRAYVTNLRRILPQSTDTASPAKLATGLSCVWLSAHPARGRFCRSASV